MEAELERRRRFGSPPFGRLVKLTVALPDREAAHRPRRSDDGRPLRSGPTRPGAGVAVLGPVPAYVARRGGRWRFHVVLRGPDPVALLGGDPGALDRGRRPREPALEAERALATGADSSAARSGRPTHRVAIRAGAAPLAHPPRRAWSPARHAMGRRRTGATAPYTCRA